MVLFIVLDVIFGGGKSGLGMVVEQVEVNFLLMQTSVCDQKGLDPWMINLIINCNWEIYIKLFPESLKFVVQESFVTQREIKREEGSFE